MNFFDTHTLLESVKQTLPVTSFLLDRYFPTNTSTDVFNTTDVIVEYKDDTKMASPFVAPRINGITILRDGYEMRKFSPAKIAPKRTLTIDELTKRGFGEALYSELTPEQRQGVMIMNDLEDLKRMNVRRKEAMASEVMFTNKLVMKEYADDLTNYNEKEVRYFTESQNPAKYTPSANWSTTETSGKQIMNDIAAMVKMLTTRGLPATEILCAPDVMDVILTNDYIFKLLDNRRLEVGGVNPELLPSGASKFARLNIKGRMIDFLSYDETYKEIDGTTKAYIPAGNVCVTAPGAGRTIYGAITQMEQADHNFHTYAGIDVPHYLADVVGGERSLTLTTAPLCMPKAKNPFIVAKVL